jgi:hypothetical protein
MEEFEGKEDVVDGDTALIVEAPKIKKSPKNSLNSDEIQGPPEDDKRLIPEQRKKKIECMIAAAEFMSKNKSFPLPVRERFIEKIAKYKKELNKLQPAV